MSFTLIYYNALLRSLVEPCFPSVILGQIFSLRKNMYSLLNFELNIEMLSYTPLLSAAPDV